ncbi:MAG: hypothetical protein AAF892_08080 [Cyanobacteria bacterium P01_D01_bin.71]
MAVSLSKARAQRRYHLQTDPLVMALSQQKNLGAVAQCRQGASSVHAMANVIVLLSVMLEVAIAKSPLIKGLLRNPGASTAA